MADASGPTFSQLSNNELCIWLLLCCRCFVDYQFRGERSVHFRPVAVCFHRPWPTNSCPHIDFLFYLFIYLFLKSFGLWGNRGLVLTNWSTWLLDFQVASGRFLKIISKDWLQFSLFFVLGSFGFCRERERGGGSFWLFKMFFGYFGILSVLWGHPEIRWGGMGCLEILDDTLQSSWFFGACRDTLGCVLTVRYARALRW